MVRPPDNSRDIDARFRETCQQRLNVLPIECEKLLRIGRIRKRS